MNKYVAYYFEHGILINNNIFNFSILVNILTRKKIDFYYVIMCTSNNCNKIKYIKI